MEHDASIIELCQRGHPAGFTRLVEAYQGRVFRTAFGCVHNREDARDVTQEVFLRTVRFIHAVEAGRPLWPWLRKMTVNLALNLLRTRRPHLSLDELPEAALPLTGEGEPAWTMTELQEAIGALPPLWGTVLMLRHQEEMEYAEIARAMGLPEGTVKTYLFRGRRALRERLANQEGWGG